jgi:hypothetical protein
MVLALDLGKVVAHRVEKIFVRAQNRTVEREFDHGLRFADRRDLAAMVGRLQFGLRDVCGQLDHFGDAASQSADRIVASLQPNFFAALMNAPVPPAGSIITRSARFGTTPATSVNNSRARAAGV